MAHTSADDLFADDPTASGRTSGTGGWIYLGVLALVFVVLAVVAYGCERDPLAGLDTVTGAEEPVELVLRVSANRVTVEGRVPGAEVRDQLVGLSRARYDDGVDDALVLDEGTTLAGGVVSVVGTATEGDVRPTGLQADIAAAFELRAGEVDVAYQPVEEEPPGEPDPVELVVTLSPTSVVLAGALPDQPTFDQVAATAQEVWGAAEPDGLAAEGATWVGGRVTIVGTVEAGDRRPPRLIAAFEALVPAEVPVDASGVEVDTGPAVLARLQARMNEDLLAAPVSFLGESAELAPGSEAVLSGFAEVLIAAPGVAVEIVGYSDPLDDPAQDVAMSEQRAQATIARLVELGVDEARLVPVGMGAVDPVADSATEEGRAANRRIAVRFPDAD
jgi:outer membrane protein OmpA-like peptidoglycan-associated protein